MSKLYFKIIDHPDHLNQTLFLEQDVGISNLTPKARSILEDRVVGLMKERFGINTVYAITEEEYMRLEVEKLGN